MSPNRFPLLAFVAGSVLCVIASPRPAHAAGTPKAVHLPPQLTSATQSTTAVHPGDTAWLQLQAMDPEGSPLTFSWESTTGTSGTPVSDASSSTLEWTAPQCLANGPPQVRGTVTNGYGLSTQALFDFDFTQSLDFDYQPEFAASGFDELTNMMLTNEGWLRLNTHQGQLSSERIVFPNEQHLSVTFVHESAGASHSLGYMYYDDLVARGYVDTRGTPGDSSDDTLVDANGNGVADLHEDLYNLAPVSGPQARPYIGTVRRCAPRSFTSQGVGLSMPDLAVNAACTPAFVRQSIPDARPGTHPPTAVDVVGSSPTEDSAPNANGYSDLGLFARIPNLLEPAHAMNNQLGLGHLLFLLADDDDDRTTFNQLGIVPDTDDFEDGIPDYDVSRYDAHGLLRPVNPDPGITPNDRTVDLGRLPAGKELVFFLVTQYQSVHSLDENQVYPCLRKALNGQCTLHLKAPIQVFFSKAKWNLDQDPVGQMPVAQRNIGCEYNEQCNVASPQSSATACYVANSSQRLCGWLDWEALMRLRQPDHGSLFLPMAAASVFPSGNGNMPHLMMNAPLTTNGQWLMGFEDLPGGADRDFNDVVFLLRTVTEGRVRSRVLSQDDASCRIAQVSFRKSDGLDARCSPQTSITYALATDCKLCSAGTCVPNPTPTWYPLSLPRGTASTTVDVSSTPGQQLCWKAQTAPGADFLCQPTILSVDVGYVSEPVAP
ncbi:DUF4114 domain-containing protein [Corallococcus carmarthensis]|uniref:DUF4114 domain-containing protein n=1 Tax=Corallococcus carmarthensis TaxID=2316728 RepID=A0A3A8K3V0_9BACT|nr:DUF4114 domain-containing protein [Corallococcus carmarthensis]RKH01967.1 DUF4114 domain-containing protein [Corallococcus carmarthensis]